MLIDLAKRRPDSIFREAIHGLYFNQQVIYYSQNTYETQVKFRREFWNDHLPLNTIYTVLLEQIETDNE